MSLFSRLNPVPRFPAYKGAYNVSSFDIEIPVKDLITPETVIPEAAKDISTVQFRVFYPSGRKDGQDHQLLHTHSGDVEHENDELERTVSREGPKSHDFPEKDSDDRSSWLSWWSGNAKQKVKEKIHEHHKEGKPVYWLPEPHQREYLSGYARFLGAGSGLAELIS